MTSSSSSVMSKDLQPLARKKTFGQIWTVIFTIF
nr:MAG TPA: hypothetical protein [Caudoviricetes sp.]